MSIPQTNIDLNKLMEALNDKADIDLQNVNITNGADSVISYKLPTESDRNWYRIYKSGWIEQGGYFVSAAAANQLFTFPVPFKSTAYQMLAVNEQVGDSGMCELAFKPYSTTQCLYGTGYNGTFYAEGFYWYAFGY